MRHYARFDLSGARSIRQFEEILQNVVDHLAKAEGCGVTLMLEVNAASTGFDERSIRVLRENARQLGARDNEFES
jgi:hypothetical protein